MLRKISLYFRRRRKMGEINPDEIFIDSSNLPEFDVHQFEGRLEQPITRRAIVLVSFCFVLVAGVFLSRFWLLQIHKGEAYAKQSEMNRLRNTDIFANRGVILDRNGIELASNALFEGTSDFARRVYAPIHGIAHLIGYVKYPTKDSSGFYFRTNYVGEDGLEKIYDGVLSGENGVRIVETDALGKVQSQSVIRPPEDGKSVTLTIDSRLQDKIYRLMASTSADYGFSGGTVAIMNVHTGDLLSLVSFPEFDSTKLTEGDREAINGYQNDPKTPFLNRAVSGLFTPGSIIKPIVAIGALNERIIDPQKKILSTGSISIANPYFPDKPSVFKDWKAHGWVDMRHAIAASSDVYFYAVGGGFEDQRGLGIVNIEKYIRMFGLGEKTGINLSHEKEGIIPNPEWKEEMFDGDVWRLGDTYNTSIGQYGLQFTPIQIVRYLAAIANEGTLLTPSLVHDDENPTKTIPLKKEDFDIIHEGMRLAVLEGTASGVNVPYIDIAGKTGTAQIGTIKQLVNSWSVGFFPYENPTYAYVVLMEKGAQSNTIGATYVMRQLLDWMHVNTPEYLQ